MIFPGMDPYLENPEIWLGFHNRFVVYLADQLQPRLRPRYIASIEARVFIEGNAGYRIADVAVRPVSHHPGPAVAVLEPDAPVLVHASGPEIVESYIAILDRNTGLEVVTVIELLSPTNKYAGPGRDSYLAKQRETLASATHLVEIDLLRLGPHTLAVPESLSRGRGPYDYLVSVCRARAPRTEFELYPRRLRDRLPRVALPLAAGDPDVTIDLQAVLAQTYEAGSYRLTLNYASPCVPPLFPADQDWADALIRESA